MKMLILLLSVVFVSLLVSAGQSSFDDGVSPKVEGQNTSRDWRDNWMGP